ncbi:putative transcription factor with zinc finger DNA-binding motif-containing protein, partial [Suhomyces tanzawaensis NRRL Y-17324]
ICQKGSACTYQHDKSRIRICRQYLLNRCYDKNCLFSHDCNEHNTPICRYFLEKKCTNSQCWFQHWKPPCYDNPNHEVWVCRPFVIGGWCGRGKKCPLLHVFNCPDFEEDGTCPKGKACSLTHQVTKRHQDLMVTPANKYVATEEEEVLVESDNEDETPSTVTINSYTVDPALLFVSLDDSRYDVYVDTSKEQSPASTSTFNENSAFLIVDDSSSESDDLGDNAD